MNLKYFAILVSVLIFPAASAFPRMISLNARIIQSAQGITTKAHYRFGSNVTVVPKPKHPRIASPFRVHSRDNSHTSEPSPPKHSSTRTPSVNMKRNIAHFVRVLTAGTALFLPSRCRASVISQLSSSSRSTIVVRGGAAAGVVPVSIPKLLLSTAPLLLVIIASRKMGLGLESDIINSTIRTFVQLSILGSVLRPIFLLKNPFLVVGYCTMMTLMAAHVACRNTKYVFRGQYDTVLGSLCTSVACTGLFACAVVVRPTPRWNPQYVIPMTGMLLGNAVNGLSLVMNELCVHLVERQRELELYLGFGATRDEAAARLLREAVRSAATPVLNMMAVVGIVSIPGMMTGQLLAGSPVMEAAKYQMLILYLIATATFGAMLAESRFILGVGFDARHVLQAHRFTKAPALPSLLHTLRHSWSAVPLLGARARSSSSVATGDTEPLRNNVQPSYTEKATKFDVLPLKEGANGVFLEEQCESNNNNMLLIDGLSKSFVVRDDIDHADDTVAQSTHVQTLFDSLSFKLKSGDMYLVRGPSGSGKTQLLRSIAGLSHPDKGNMQLDGTGFQEFSCSSDWRKQVRYVPQYKVDIPGSPRDFVRRVTSFRSWNRAHWPKEQEMLQSTIELVEQWGLPASSLDKEWSMLSGGEAQRVILALSLASKPNVLLLDESTSAMDMETKVAVERTIHELAKKHNLKVVWVSHDPGILSREYE